MPPIPAPPSSSTTPPRTHEDPFSWADTLNIAFSSCSSSLGCIPCLRKIPSDDSLQNHQHSSASRPDGGLYDDTVNNIPRARPDELEALLASSSLSSSFSFNSDGEESDRFSLHTNPGTNPRKRTKKKKSKAKITLFGFDLFGMGNRKQEGRIRLVEESGDDALYRDDSTSALALLEDEPYTDNAPPPSRPSKHKRKSKKAPFDADAAPLSSARIAELAASGGGGSSLNPISPPDSPSSTYAIPPSRTSSPSRPHSHSQSQSESSAAYPFSPPLTPLSPIGTAEDESVPKKKKKRSSKKGSSLDLQTQLAHLERLKAQGTLPESNGGLEFEGFQGSGSLAPLPLSPRPLEGIVAKRSVGTMSTSSSGSSSRTGSGRARSEARTDPTTPSAYSDSSPYQHKQQQQEIPLISAPSAFANEPEEEEEADLDGEMYSGPRRRGNYVPGGSRSSGSRSHGRSDSRGESAIIPQSQSGGGRPSHSRSDSLSSGGRAQYAQYPASPPVQGYHASGVPSPLGPLGSSAASPFIPAPLDDVPRKKSKSKKSTSSSNRSNSTSRSHSIASPTSPGFMHASAGFSNSDDAPAGRRDEFPSTGLGKTFVSAGFGKGPAVGGGGLRANEMARMLRREEGDDFEGF